MNAGGSGFYRVRYAPEHHRRLASRLDALDLLERFNLLGDSWAVVVAQRAGPEDFLLLAEALGNEDDPDIWAQVTAALSLLHRAVDDDARPLVASYTRALLGPVLTRLGWEARPGEGPRTPTLRAQVVAALGTIGRRRRRPGRSAPAPRRRPERRGGARPRPGFGHPRAPSAPREGPRTSRAFLEHYRRPATPQEEMRYLYALAGFADPQLAARTFELALTEVRSQDSPFVIQLLLNNRDNGPAVWERVRRALGRAGGAHPRQHPPPHARWGDVVVPRSLLWPATSRRSCMPIPCPSASARSIRPWNVSRSTSPSRRRCGRRRSRC